MTDKLKQLLQDQLNAIPSLNEYFNRLPCNTKDWIIEAVTQAFKDWLTQRIKLANSIDDTTLDSIAYAYLQGVKGELDKLLEELK